MRKLDDVYVVGVGLHPFTGMPTPVREMAAVAGNQALQDAGLRFADIGTVYNGYRYVEPGVGGLALVKELGLNGAPIVQVENASATGSVAFREAVLKVACGDVACAMALGVGSTGGPTIAEAGPRDGGPDVDMPLLPAAYFALWAVRRMHDAGTTIETYAAIAAKNWNHARLNPYARRRADHLITVAEVLASTKIAHPHTSMMSAATGGGAACAIVANRETALRLAQGRPLVKVTASQMQSERFVPGHVFLGALVGSPEMTRSTALAAYEQAGIAPSDLNLVQVHDAFPVEELLYMELLGLCGDGEADRLIAEGATSLGGRIPFSTDGGLIGRGHPIGPTGLAQIWELTLQLRGHAGDRQVSNARVGMAHMIGAGSVCVIHILQRA